MNIIKFARYAKYDTYYKKKGNNIMKKINRLFILFIICLTSFNFTGCKNNTRQIFIGNNTIHFDEEDNISILSVYRSDGVIDLVLTNREEEKQYSISTTYIENIVVVEFDIFIYYRGDSCSILVETNDQEFYIFNATIVIKKGK